MRSVHLLLVPVAAAVAVLAGCSSSPPSSAGPGTVAKSEKPVSPTSIGSDLYAPAKEEPIVTTRSAEPPIVVPNAIIRMDRKQIVSAESDGRLLCIGTAAPNVDPSKMSPEEAKLYYTDATYERRTKILDPEEIKSYAQHYKRLRVGDPVVKGMNLAFIDDSDSLAQIASSIDIIAESDKAIFEAEKGKKYVEEQIEILNKPDISSRTELLNAQATLSRYAENIFTSRREKEKAKGDYIRANVLRRKHQCFAAFNGQIERILVEPGEFVKAGQPLLEILSLDSVRIEGTMPMSDAVKVGVHWAVEVEPTVLIASDDRSGSVGHLKEVTAIATAVPDRERGRAFVYAASLDNTVSIWEPDAAVDQTNQWRLRHPVGVRSLAVCTVGSRILLATGADDGRVRLWDVTDPARTGEKPMAEFTDAHTTAVSALAFSPDGKYLASAAGRDIALWKVEDEKKLYSLPEEHKDAVTCLRFTPQARLVTASRDKTVRVWKVGTTGAEVLSTFDHRKGNVDHLGLSSGGGRVLFDKKDGELDVVSLQDGRTLGSIRLAVEGARFSALALFSPEDGYILTANSDGKLGGELQIWKTPDAGGRGEEVRRLVTQGRAMPTCAAFGGLAGNGYIVVGTIDGGVQLWREKDLKATRQKIEGRILSLIPEDSRTVGFQVEILSKPGQANDTLMMGLNSKLLNKSSATLIIRPGQKVTPPQPPVPTKNVGAPPPLPLPLPNTIVPVSGTTAKP